MLTLESGVRFVPDGQDAKAGMAATIGGGIAAVFGVAFLGILAEGKQSEPWMRYAGPVLLATGAYPVWTGREKTRAAKTSPRLTGVYLFDDGLVHVGSLGCQTFPRERVRAFSYREQTENRWKLLVRYVAKDGAERGSDNLDGMPRERLFVLALVASFTVMNVGCKKPPKPPSPKASPTTEEAIVVDDDWSLDDEEDEEDEDDALFPSVP